MTSSREREVSSQISEINEDDSSAVAVEERRDEAIDIESKNRSR